MNNETDFDTQVSDYWKLQANKATTHAREMYRAMERAKQKILDVKPTNRTGEALGIINDALLKHERYFQNRSNRNYERDKYKK